MITIPPLPPLPEWRHNDNPLLTEIYETCVHLHECFHTACVVENLHGAMLFFGQIISNLAILVRGDAITKQYVDEYVAASKPSWDSLQSWTPVKEEYEEDYEE